MFLNVQYNYKTSAASVSHFHLFVVHLCMQMHTYMYDVWFM